VHYKSALDCVRSMLRHEGGLASLYRGASVSVAKTVPGAMIQVRTCQNPLYKQPEQEKPLMVEGLTLKEGQHCNRQERAICKTTKGI